MAEPAGRWAIAIHGGAGVISASDPEALEAAKEALRRCLSAGQRVLQRGGSALDAVEAAVVALEEEPCFNAGKGAVYTRRYGRGSRVRACPCPLP